MILKTGWEWKGDYFDTEIPLSLDLHFRLWDAETERFLAPGVEEFWDRRTAPVLHRADALGCTALHLLRHLLRSNLRVYHVYELAYFLETHAADDAFWFGCRPHPAAAEPLPDDVRGGCFPCACPDRWKRYTCPRRTSPSRCDGGARTNTRPSWRHV